MNGQNLEPVVVQTAHQHIFSKFHDIQLPDIMNFFGGATSLEPFLEAYETSKTKRLFPYEWSDHLDEKQNTELTPFDAIYRKLRDCNPSEEEYTDYVNLVENEMTFEQSVGRFSYQVHLQELRIINTCNKKVKMGARTYEFVYGLLALV